MSNGCSAHVSVHLALHSPELRSRSTLDVSISVSASLLAAILEREKGQVKGPPPASQDHIMFEAIVLGKTRRLMPLLSLPTLLNEKPWIFYLR